MSELMLFEGNEVMVLFPGDVIFDFKGDFIVSAKDVSAVLEYQGEGSTNKVLKFCKTDHIYLVTNSDISNRDVRKLNNAGEKFISNLSLNRVLGQSEQPKAIPFQDWLYEDMLPTVSKHGAYMTPNVLEKTMLNPDFIIQLATQIKVQQEENKILELKIETDKPKVHFAESLEISKDSILVADLAKLIKQKGVDIGEHRLYRWMREEGYLIKSGSEYNRPTQKSMNLGLFEIKTGQRGGSDGTIKLTHTTKVTGKGQLYFINKFLKAA